jgi:peptidoglycan hydrolase-like protein with peptidoglycan-binding domain
VFWPRVEAQSNPRILELEEGLAELGYDPGPVDGVLEPKTREAITAFQRDHDLITDGKYSGLLLFSVNVERDLAQQEATPEGRATKAESARLLALSDSDRMEPLVISTPEAMAMPAELVEGPPDPGRSGAGCPLCKIGAWLLYYRKQIRTKQKRF